jgi:hypothetical protein
MGTLVTNITFDFVVTLCTMALTVIVATIIVKVFCLIKLHKHTEAFCSAVIGCCAKVTTVNATYFQQNKKFSNP